MADSDDTPTTLTGPRSMPDFVAWIEVDGEPAPVYSIGTRGGKSWGYIEASEGAQFDVHYRDERTEGLAYTAQLYLDDHFVEGHVYAADDPVFSSATDSDEREQVISSSFVTPTTARPFKFSKISETDNEAAACKGKQLQKAGSIELRIYRIENVQDGNISKGVEIEIDDIVVHEDHKLNRSHQTSLGDIQVVEEEADFADFDLIDPYDESPYAVFDFRCRSLALLDLEGHVSALATPSPTPPPIRAERTPPAGTTPDATPSGATTPAHEQATGADVDPGYISSSDDEVEDAVENVDARLARLEAENAELRAKLMRRSSTVFGVKEEEKPRIKKVKLEHGSSRWKGKGKVEVIVLD